jgi:hypothetical protein
MCYLDIGGSYFLAVLKYIVDFSHVDWSGRHEDSCGSTELGRPHRRFSAEEIEKRKRLVQPRQALEGWQRKSFFDFH